MLDRLFGSRKYFLIFKLAFEESIFYRANTFVYFFRQSLWFFAEILIWLQVFQQKSQVGDYDLAGIVIYFLMVYLVFLLTGSSVAGWLSSSIIDGSLTRYFFRPISVHWAIFSRDFGKKVSQLLWIFLVWIIVFLVFGLSIGGRNIGLFALALFNSVFLVFLFRFFLGVLAFWFISIRSLLWVVEQVESFLGGGWVPLSLLPVGIAKIAGFSPFGLSMSFPVRLFQGKIEKPEIIASFILQYLWLVFFYILISILWRKGTKRYEAVGN